MLEKLDDLAGRWLDWRTDQAVKRFPPELQELNLHKAEADKNGWKIVMFAPGIVELANQAADLLNAEHAKNYVQFDMMPRLDRGKPPIRVTVAWAIGEAPATRAARLEDENKALREARDASDYRRSCLEDENIILRDAAIAALVLLGNMPLEYQADSRVLAVVQDLEEALDTEQDEDE